MVTFGAQRLDWLKRQIEQGWQIEQPVIQRAVLAGVTHQPAAYEFVLRQEYGCQVVAVPECPEVAHFLHEHALPVIIL